ncbi:C-type lectin lectoxin-Lio3-like [Lingula anatina]|uniref:C-type lectin lectoxin-Lio3-like n=1 Tax=Lingula anatina TaxID=7574 RepID=A0A1S3J5H4_LINAN|nr:C-type lectin lectoxin-Lio3-like [Lingula anatina]|eukprot:XP_013405672.1 C-type lectin lectoxin-Lio3-like [Lingula anatina]
MDSYAAFILFFIFLHLGKTELICDDSMVTLPNGLCLQLHKVSTTWTKARVACQKQNGSLVAISNNTVDSFIRKYLNGSKVTADVWLGAKTRKRWFWKDDDSELTWFAWGLGEPNDDNSAEDYVMLWQRADYLWNDQHGDTKENHLVISKFICEDTNRPCSQKEECADKGHGVSRCVYHNATCFYLEGHYGIGTNTSHANQVGTTWSGADASCKGKKKRLAHIENWSTLNALRQRIREDYNLAGNYWIGAVWDREQGAKWTWENGLRCFRAKNEK